MYTCIKGIIITRHACSDQNAGNLETAPAHTCVVYSVHGAKKYDARYGVTVSMHSTETRE